MSDSEHKNRNASVPIFMSHGFPLAFNEFIQYDLIFVNNTPYFLLFRNTFVFLNLLVIHVFIIFIQNE